MDTCPMSFEDGEFDLVLNRHAQFNPSEVARVLLPGGTFLTQQVHGMSSWDLLAAFDAAPSFPDNSPSKYVPLMEAAGLIIEAVEECGGASCVCRRGSDRLPPAAIPWEVPEFTVRTHSRVFAHAAGEAGGGRGAEFPLGRLPS